MWPRADRTVLLVSETNRGIVKNIIAIGAGQGLPIALVCSRRLLCSNQKRLSIMNSKTVSREGEAVMRAVETYDHLLWEAIIRVCGMAFSQAFEQMESRVRVVYKTYDPKFPPLQSKDPVDPRGAFWRIEAEAKRLISLPLPIRMLGEECRDYDVAGGLCSHPSYHHFLLFGSKILTEEDRINILGLGSRQHPVFCNFVEFGQKGEQEHICCPCTGQHLENSQDLLDFKVDLQKPTRKGKDTYEFRFEVVATT